MRDKTFYIVVDGQTVRVRAPKKPDKELTEALSAMIKVIQEKAQSPDTIK